MTTLAIWRRCLRPHPRRGDPAEGSREKRRWHRNLRLRRWGIPSRKRPPELHGSPIS